MPHHVKTDPAQARELLGRVLDRHLSTCDSCTDAGPCDDAQGVRELRRLLPLLLVERSALVARLGAIELLASGFLPEPGAAADESEAS